MKEYCGRFPVNKGLTKKLNYGDWLIYRDPENGIYLYSPSLDEEINPYIWNITAKGWSEKIRNMLVDDIKNFLEKNYR